MTDRMRTLGFLMIVAAMAVLLFLLDPTRVGIFPPCPLHEMTGLWCPGCGSTRALHQLLHGNLAMAFRLNPLAILLLPLVGYLTVRTEHVTTIRSAWIWMLLGVVVAFGILRNIPAYPFTFLTP